MAAYVVEIIARAAEDLDALSRDVSDRIEERLSELEESPQPRGDTVKRLQGFTIPTYRFRVGDYRAIFRIVGNRVFITPLYNS